jgi:enoyl-CoA hydratase
MNHPNLLVEISEKIAIVKIDNPPGNCLSDEVLNLLDQQFEGLNKDPLVKVIILTGGERCFSTGADITGMGKCKTAEEAKAMSVMGQKVLLNIENSRKPVIAAVNGFCLGGGLELAICCHIRICSDHSVFGMPEIHLGMIPAFGGSYRLLKIMGRSRAIQMILTGEKFTSEVALATGLVNKIVPKELLMTEAMKLAGKLTTKSSSTMGQVLKSMITGAETDIVNAMKIETSCVGELYDMHDLVEGVHAYLEKRKPDFTDF